MKCNQFAIFTLSLCFATFAQGREVYKCVSADGRTSYMDKPCDKSAKSATEVIINKEDTPSAAEANKQHADWKKKSDEFNERYQSRLRKEEEDAAKKKADEEKAALRAKRIADEEERLQREEGARAAAARRNGF
ncbi:DUF4124 domain-containing protein [Undibacterium sp. Ji50W]|uniref:DUF4124 domain-containing protein n=1 Tax=Undibacterium sp. Ji50W TaxID=3413041 RepID=UPI003BF33721